jgi:hypothetical protein
VKRDLKILVQPFDCLPAGGQWTHWTAVARIYIYIVFFYFLLRFFFALKSLSTPIDLIVGV